MFLAERSIDFLYRMASGNVVRRTILTPIFGLFYLIITSLFVIIPILIERWLHIPKYIDYRAVIYISYVLFLIGIILIVWTNAYFILAKGSPVPVNPPRRLVDTGPFSISRNPMTTGYFFVLYGFGFYYSSLLSLLIFTPLFIFIHYKYFKAIEEPELEKRLGEDYIKYKKRVPMFFPHIK